MANQMETSPPLEHLDIDTVHSRITELTNILATSKYALEPSSSDSEKLIQDCIQNLQDKVKKVLSESSNFTGFDDKDLDLYAEHLREELRMVEEENVAISKEIESLKQSHMEGTCGLQRELEGLNCMLDYAGSQGLKGAKVGGFLGCSGDADHSVLSQPYSGPNFEVVKLNHQLENKETTLKSLLDLDYVFRRFQAIEKIEDIFTGLKVVEFEGKTIRLMMRTYIPKVEWLVFHQKLEDTSEMAELNHELHIEVKEGTLELKTVEIFPNDVYVADIVEAATSFRQVFSTSSLNMRPSLDWFLHKVQERIVMSTLRRLMVKTANKSRHTIDYLDRDELIVAHLVGGINAFIRPSQGWPLLNSPLKLVSLKSSGHNVKDISLSLLCKVEEVANSLDIIVRKNVVDFVDAIEEVLVQQSKSITPS
ncbi:hypothetical protein Dimus_033160 [Dionaea muscipula]